MAITVVGVGTVASGAAAITPPFTGSELADDILIGIAESVGNEAYFSGGAPPTGWAHVLGSPVNVDSSTRLTVIWKRFVGGDTAPSWGDSGNHNVGRIITLRGVKSTGNPWNVDPTTAQETAANTSAEWPSVTTTVADCLIVLAIATGRDAALTNVNLGTVTGGTGLSSITERMDDWIATGTGGGIGMVTAFRATAGATDTPTATMGSSDAKALMTIALEPAAGAAVSAEATLAGTGTLTAAAIREAVAAATLAGTGTLTATIRVVSAWSATVSATTFAGAIMAEATLAGTGTITAGVTLEARAAAALTGTGTITAAAAVTRFAAVSLDGTGTITAAAAVTQFAAVTLAGTGTITAAAALVPLRVAATLAGVGTITAAAVVGSVAILAGTGVITAAAVVTRFPTATLAGTGTITAAVVAARVAAANLAGVGTITTGITALRLIAATLIGVGLITAEMPPEVSRGLVVGVTRQVSNVNGRTRNMTTVTGRHRDMTTVSGR